MKYLNIILIVFCLFFVVGCAPDTTLEMNGEQNNENADEEMTDDENDIEAPEAESDVLVQNVNESLLELAKPRLEDDFYTHVNYESLEAMKIPSDRTSWSHFSVLANNSDSQLKAIFEDLREMETNNSDIQKAALYYNMVMDEKRIEKLGISPLEAEFEYIKNHDFEELFLHYTFDTPIETFFSLGAYTDPDNSSVLSFDVYQADFPLGSKKYYFEEPESLEEYKKFLVDLFTLLGEDDPEKAMETIVRIETHAANYSNSVVENRDPIATNNMYEKDEFLAEFPGLPWEKVFDELPDRYYRVNVGQPRYLAEMSDYLPKLSEDDYRLYLKFRLVDTYIQLLSSEYFDLNFDFFYKYLSGQQEQEPRWKFANRVVTSHMQDTISQIYVNRHFDEESKKEITQLVANLKDAFEKRVEKSGWMSNSTKIKAIEKLDYMNEKLGYPDVWRTYERIDVVEGELVQTSMNFKRYYALNGKYGLMRVGLETNRTLWSMAPYVVNAYFSPVNNEIAFPAAILQKPFFSIEQTDAENYAGIGMVIGHEITHGFDDSGRKRDKHGNLKEWWLQSDKDKFDAKASEIVKQYDKYELYPDRFVDGNLTLGENIADIGGISIALDAYHMVGDNNKEFFEHTAKIWTVKMREERAIQLLNMDPHSPTIFRVNGALRNIDAFYETYNITSNDAMFLEPDQRVLIW